MPDAGLMSAPLVFFILASRLGDQALLETSFSWQRRKKKKKAMVPKASAQT